MKKTLLIVKNITHEGPGLLEASLQDHDIASHCADLSAGEPFPDPGNYRAIVVLGGPQSANDETPAMQLQLRQIRIALKEKIPFFGICLGMQSLVKAGGGRVVKCAEKEIGFIAPDGQPYRMELTVTGSEDPLFAGLGKSFPVFQLHGETVELASTDMKLLGSGSFCPIQAVKVGNSAYGLQCHFEVTRAMFSEWTGIDDNLRIMDRTLLMEQFDAIRKEYTETGMKLMNNFLRISSLI